MKKVQLSLYTPWRFSGGGGAAPLILNLYIGKERAVTFSPCLFTPGEIPARYPLCMILDECQSRSGRFREEKISYFA
jgi:hypothetical protein